MYEYTKKPTITQEQTSRNQTPGFARDTARRGHTVGGASAADKGPTPRRSRGMGGALPGVFLLFTAQRHVSSNPDKKKAYLIFSAAESPPWPHQLKHTGSSRLKDDKGLLLALRSSS